MMKEEGGNFSGQRGECRILRGAQARVADNGLPLAER